MAIRIQAEAFDYGAESTAFAAGAAGAGAVVTFAGIVRDLPDGSLLAMEIEHYPGMTEKALAEIDAQARTRWTLTDTLIIHRFGPMTPGDMIMMVATASAHRAEAFAAAEYLMDFLKSRAPFWKKETTTEGSAGWVAASDADESALKRW